MNSSLSRLEYYARTESDLCMVAMENAHSDNRFDDELKYAHERKIHRGYLAIIQDMRLSLSATENES